MQRSVSNAASIYLLPPSSRMPTTLPRPGSSLPRLASPSRRASQSLTDSLRNSPWLLEGIRISESPFELRPYGRRPRQLLSRGPRTERQARRRSRAASVRTNAEEVSARRARCGPGAAGLKGSVAHPTDGESYKRCDRAGAALARSPQHEEDTNPQGGFAPRRASANPPC